jgi:hypothetical protein
VTTTQAEFREWAGPFEDQLVQRAIQIFRDAERHGSYAVLVAREAEAVLALFEYLGWDELAVTFKNDSPFPGWED